MKKLYYYFLYRIYRMYNDKMKENNKTALLSITAVSTTTVSINLITLYFAVNYFDLVSLILNKFCIAMFMIFGGIVNYYLFVRKGKFLTFHFQKDTKGGYYVILYIVLIALFAFAVGSYNREKILSTQLKILSKESKRESLENKIRSWLNKYNFELLFHFLYLYPNINILISADPFFGSTTNLMKNKGYR